MSSEVSKEMRIVINDDIRKINLNILENGSKTILFKNKLVVINGEENQSDIPDNIIPIKATYATLNEFFLLKKKSIIRQNAIVATNINSGIKKFIL